MLRLIVLVLLSTLAAPAFAQGVTVYTTVSQARDGVSVGQVLSRSNTILHAGRAYDHMEELGELVICDPTQRRITLIHRGEFGTRLAFEELVQYVNVGRTETENYANELASSPDNGTIASSLKFQLLPTFDKRLTDTQLVLHSPHWTYQVDTYEPPTAGFAQSYADYADVAARLNFVLHPQSFFPAVRERLNDELRNHGRVPTKVHVKATLGEPIELVAEHTYRWKLEHYDRSQVRRFDSLNDSTSVEWMSFRDYHKRVIQGY